MDEPPPAAAEPSTIANGTWSLTAAPASAAAPPVAAPSQPSLPPASSGSDVLDLRSSRLYLNRELSWLEFNARVLAEADSEAVPLLERLKFHAIVASNLDEFFMVRVAGLKQHVTGEIDELGPEGMTVGEQLAAISTRVHALVAVQSASLAALLPRLAEAGIMFLKPA